MSKPNAILSTLALEAAVCCTSSDRNRPQLNGVLVQSGGRVTATDGHKLISIGPSVTDAEREQWPAVASPNGGTIGQEGIILSPAGIKAALACEKVARPEVKRFELLHRRVALTVAESGAVEAAAGFASRASVETMEGPYPNVEQVFPVAEPTFSVGLGVDNLRGLLNAVEKCGAEAVRLDFINPLSAVRVSAVPTDSHGRNPSIPFRALIMPVRLS